jgi:hypothetical protein
MIRRSHPQFGLDLPEKSADRPVSPLSDGYFGLNDATLIIAVMMQLRADVRIIQK